MSALGGKADVMMEERKANVVALEALRRDHETLRIDLDELTARLNRIIAQDERAAPAPYLRAVD
jgi:hypothetical protein